MSDIRDLSLTILIFLSLDYIWIEFVMNKHYNKVINSIQGSPMNWYTFPSILGYACLLGGFYHYVIQRIESKASFTSVVSLAIPFALCVYGFFDFMNATIYKNYDMSTAFIDLIWGVANCCITACLVSYVRDW